MGASAAISHVAVADRTDEHLVDGSDENFLKGLDGAIVLVENGCGNVMGVAKVGDLGDRRDRWNGGIVDGVNWSNESRGRDCCVHGGGESEL